MIGEKRISLFLPSSCVDIFIFSEWTVSNILPHNARLIKTKHLRLKYKKWYKIQMYDSQYKNLAQNPSQITSKWVCRFRYLDLYN